MNDFNCRRAMAFSFPANLQRWLSIFMTTTLMSIILGSIFWQVRSDQSEQEDVNDRLAMHYVVGVVGVWPTLMLIITQVWNEKDSVARDINDQLYGRLVYFFSEVNSPILTDSFMILSAFFQHSFSILPAFFQH